VSTSPKSIADLARLWTRNGGASLGIVGNAAHTWGYHIGRDRIYAAGGRGAADYSALTARDRAGLTDAASALDLGRLHGSLPELRRFSRWLVAQCRAGAPGTADVREVIYSPDGRTVWGWSRENGASSAPVEGYGDASHLWHTHISFYRDSRARSKLAIFAPYFAPAPPRPSWVLRVAARAQVHHSVIASGRYAVPDAVRPWGSRASSARCGPTEHILTTAGDEITVVHVLTGAFAGRAVHLGPGVTASAA
jgi:hypothetical protein